MKTLFYLLAVVLFYNIDFAQVETNIAKPENVLVVYNSLDDTSGFIANY